MAAYLTTARLALVAALQADATLLAGVRTWRAFGPGLRQRLAIEHSHCPMLAVYPQSVDVAGNYNVAEGITQDLTVLIVTSGQDAAPAETLAAAALDVIETARGTCLSLTALGLTNLTIGSVSWGAEPDEDGSHIMWTVRIAVRLHYIRR